MQLLLLDFKLVTLNLDFSTLTRRNLFKSLFLLIGMVKLSLCMIVKNEEEFLPQCLESVKDIVDEIIIVDTGSTDNTVSIANSFGAKVLHHKWDNDFSKARNISLRHATGDWILVLDADECIAKRDLAKIKNLIETSEYVGYYLVQRNYSNEIGLSEWESSKNDPYSESKAAAGWYPNIIARLFKNDKRIFFQGVVHEIVDYSLTKAGKVKKVDIPIHHFGTLKTKVIIDRKKRTYTDLAEKKAEESKSFLSYYQLARCFLHVDFPKAIEELKRSIKLNPRYFEAWHDLGAAYIETKQFDKAEDALLKAVELKPDSSSAHQNLGIVYSEQGNYSEGIKEFIAAIKLNPNDADAYFNLGLAYKRRGHDSSNIAYKAFKKAVELNPEYKKKVKFGKKH